MESDQEYMENNWNAVICLLDGGLEQLAGLLVKECADIVNHNDHDESTLGDRLLLDHFGIKRE